MKLAVRSTKLITTTLDLFRKYIYPDQADCFWLDSSRVIEGMSRYSILGNTAGPNSEVILIDARSRRVRVQSRRGIQEHRIDDPLAWLTARMTERQLQEPLLSDCPFGGGYIGYFGYEAKAITCGHAGFVSPTWDIGLVFPDRYFVVDHREGSIHVICVAEDAMDGAQEDWLRVTVDQLDRINSVQATPRQGAVSGKQVSFKMRHDRTAYLTRIDAALEAIKAGESYEICLTNQICCADVNCDPLDVYSELRARNPAPYGAFFRLAGASIACSSPERFLKCDRMGNVETKPIKGTAARSADVSEDLRIAAALEDDEKSRSENLMITDLLRNDLSRVCRVGSVHVPALMRVETYATVHQLVTTVRGQLAPGRSLLDCLRAAFPGGSMTGAPKIRTLDIIDALEGGPRGIYSGCIGWIGLDGSADLNIVIRTIVIEKNLASVGVGGAIVAMSDPVEEYEEMLIKARPSLEAIAAAVTGKPDRYQLEGEWDGDGVTISVPTIEDIPTISAGLEPFIADLQGPSYVRDDAKLLLSRIIAGELDIQILAAFEGAQKSFQGFITWSSSTALRTGGKYAIIEDLWVPSASASNKLAARLLDAMTVRCGALGIRVTEVALPRGGDSSVCDLKGMYASNGFSEDGFRFHRIVA
ncbi:aminodeoxychorismate synthase component I [Bradyrhizobium sp. CCBAU 21359]|uniref:aminodeoxychorismate synthase component I n=1 Tax=Bradyrhizobium sp. CCBAU 21359 TaxID=1325080 RepID=UPI0023050079|nr:aminodeoxychorismate synthase component I [Bradyrhizobium sp. CCBAU 21359]